MRFTGNQVKARGAALAGKGVIVHADKHDNPKGNAPHGQHGAKGDTARHEAKPLLLMLKACPEPGEHHRRRNVAGKLRHRGNVSKLFGKLGNGRKLPLGAVGRGNEIGQQRLKLNAPSFKRSGTLKAPD